MNIRGILMSLTMLFGTLVPSEIIGMPTATAASTVITTTADTYANGGAPNTNFGTSCCLAAGGTAPYITYLRFVVPSGITGAALNMSTSTQSFAGTTSKFDVTEAGNAWNETTLNYLNRPAFYGSALGTFTGAVAGGKVSIPLTNAASLAGREVTFAITGGSDSWWMWGREHGASTAPSLSVTYGSPNLSVGILGDSISEGCCSSASTTFQAVARPYWRVTADILGWANPDVNAQGGTGYLNPGTVSGRQPYPVRIGAFLDAHPGMQALVIEGGGNDSGSDIAALTNAVNTTFDVVKTKVPGTKIYVLGPYSPNGSGYTTQRSIIGQSAKDHGFVFIDQVAEGWMTNNTGLLWSDNFHPNEQGHDVLGHRFASDIAALPAALR